MKLKSIKDVNILVAGDIMLDHYVMGDVDRISPEAPVPIVKITKEYNMLGGCGNVIRNLREIGVGVTCVAAIGADIPGASIAQKLVNLDVKMKMVRRKDLVTTEKIRYIANAGYNQMLRVDREKIQHIKPSNFNVDEDYDIIIVSDYAKGMVTAELMSKLKKSNIPILVDPKPQNMWLYSDVFMLTPNKKEYDEMCMSATHPFAQGIRYILKTLGKEGMELFENGKEVCSVPTIPVDVYNVTGAGDTVVAIVGVCLAMGLDVERAVKVANKCAQYVVTQPDTSVVPKKMFKEFVRRCNE